MSFSFSQPQTSSFLAPNELLDLERLRLAPQEAADVHQNRMLEQQTSQRNISAFDMEQAGRIAGAVLDETAYPTPEARAAAWPTLIARARANGAILPHASDTYPGDDVMRSTVRMAMPSADLFKQGLAGQAASDFDTRWRTPPPTTGSGTTATAPASGGGTNAPPGTSTPTAPQNVADIHPDLTQFTLPSGVGLTVAKSAAPQFQGLLTDLEAAGYKLDPNTTGGYNPRNIAGTNTPSQHAYGLAMDVNWQRNPRGANTQADIPPDLARKLAAKWGLTWGGDWQGADRDPMHFEVARGTGPGTDHPAGVATGWNANNPLNLTADTGGVVTPHGTRLASFGSMADGVAATAAKLQSYQTDRGLDTVRKMYTEWHKGSPVNEADMQRIAGAMGVGVDQPFQLDPTKTAAWITAAQPGETGTAGKRLSPADITAGVRQATAAPLAAPGGVAARVGGTDVAGPGAGTGGAPGQPVAMPRDQAVVQAQRTGQPVPVAGVGGLWALPNGNLTSTPPAATTAQAPPAQQPTPSQPPAPATTTAQPAQPTIPPPPQIVANDLTREQLAEIPVLKRQVQLGQITAAEADKVLLGYQTANRAAQRQYALDVQAQQEKAKADAIAAENLRLSQESGGRDTQRLAIEQKKAEQGADAHDRNVYNVTHLDPASQQYADSWSALKWETAPNGNVIEHDVSMYPAPARSVQRPSFLPAPTPQGLDEVRKVDTDARVITSAIDHYVEVFKATGGGTWGAYFDNPRSDQAQKLNGAFIPLKTFMRSPAFFNTGVLQPAEMEALKQDLSSPQSLRGLFATPEALATRLGEIKLGVLNKQDAERRSIGQDGIIVRDKADYNKVPSGGRYYDENGDLKVKQ